MAWDDDDLLMVTKRHRRQLHNLLAGARVSVLVYARRHPVHYVHVEGRARIASDDPWQLIDRMALAYTGAPHVVTDPVGEAARVAVRTSPSRVRVYEAAA